MPEKSFNDNHEQIKVIELQAIEPSPFQRRKYFNEDKLKVVESMLIRTLKERPAFDVTNKQEKTKFQVEIFDEPIVKKYYETIVHLIERNC